MNLQEILQENGPTIQLDTSLGTIHIKLRTDHAPITCEHFLRLIESNFYDRTVFHSIIPDELIMGGRPRMNPDGTREEEPERQNTEPGLERTKGAVGMVLMDWGAEDDDLKLDTPAANSGSMFFICLDDTPSSDFEETIFGHVVEGLDVVRMISNQPRIGTNRPEKPISILKSLALNMEPR